MDIKRLHPWNVTYAEAVKIQEDLKKRLVIRKLGGNIRHIAGLDVSYARENETMWAGIVVLRFPGLDTIEEKWSQSKLNFPYIPGLLSFREIPALLDTVRKVEVSPDLILCDGQGIAHPRGIGLASHIGILLNQPTIGCAKSRLVGEYCQVGEQRGDFSYLKYHGKTVGAVVRTRKGVKPVFASPGFAVTVDDCIRFVLETSSRYRIPEPTRRAHLLVSCARRKGQ